MAEIINLNRTRKAKARGDAATTAAANRASFGRTKGQKARDAALEAQRQRTLDQAKREQP